MSLDGSGQRSLLFVRERIDQERQRIPPGHGVDATFQIAQPTHADADAFGPALLGESCLLEGLRQEHAGGGPAAVD